MNNYIIEPVQKETEIKCLCAGSISLNDFTFLIKNDTAVVGYSQLIPLPQKPKSKALWIQKIICSNKEAAKELMKEIAMYSWELGYDAIFSDVGDSILKESGFIELNGHNINVSVMPNKVLALELSWQGLKKFEKRN